MGPKTDAAIARICFLQRKLTNARSIDLMKRTVKYALSAAMAAMFVVPAFAQDTPFPDTKENHWAYEAVTRLKADGILVGYPNGMFIGGRLATRYEMAVAINAAYTKLKNITDGLTKQIDDINGKIKELQDRPAGIGVSQADFDALKSALNDVRDQVSGMKSYAQDIADLKKLSEKFEKDLASLGVDVDDLKKNLSSIDKRVTTLEAHKMPIDIHGDANFLSINGYGTNRSYGVDVTGRPTGFGRDSNAPGAVTGGQEDFTFLHEVAADLTTTNTSGPKGEAIIVIGNMLGAGSQSSNFARQTQGVNGLAGGPFGTQSTLFGGSPYSEGNESIYIQKAVASWGDGMGGMPFHGEVGRMGLKLGDYILARPDYTPYYSNERWDNGQYAVDGGKVGFTFGAMKLHIFAGRTSSQTDSQGTLIQPMIINPSSINNFTGLYSPNAAKVDQLMGAHLWVPIGKDGSVDLSYVLLAANTATAGINRIQDYGVDANYKLSSNIKVWGGYSKTDTMNGTHSVNNKNDSRATAYGSYDSNNWGVQAGYRYIEPNFLAPGSWGRIGTWWNPTDIMGVDASAHIDLAGTFTLKGGYEYYTGTGKVASGLQTKDKVSRATIDLMHKFGGVGVDLGFEDVIFNMPDAFPGGKPEERWYNVGASYDFSDSTKFSILWQISDFDAKGGSMTFFPGLGGNALAGSARNRGGLITTQFSIKI